MKEKEQKKLDAWRLNNMKSEYSASSQSEIILGEAIKHWFYKFRYLNKRGRTFDREESTLNNQI